MKLLESHQWAQDLHGEIRFFRVPFPAVLWNFPVDGHRSLCLWWSGGGYTGSTKRTLLHGKINPKDWQVLSLGDVGFLLFFRVVSGDYGKPCYIYGFSRCWDYVGYLLWMKYYPAMWGLYEPLQGGFKYFFCSPCWVEPNCSMLASRMVWKIWWFHIFSIPTPDPWGKWLQFDEHIFQMGWN